MEAVPCANCGQMFKPSHRGRRFCSLRCSARYLAKAGKKPGFVESFRRYYADGKKPWNYSAAGKGMICPQCGSTFSVHPHKLKDGRGKFCSVACYDAARANPLLPEEKRERQTPEYKAWRKAVMERDGYTCVRCGRSRTYLEAHHIRRFKDNPALRTDLSNGETLCYDCHMVERHHRKEKPAVCLDCGRPRSRKAKRCLRCHNILASRSAASKRRKHAV